MDNKLQTFGEVKPALKEFKDSISTYYEDRYEILATIDTSKFLGTTIEIDREMYEVVGTPAMATFLIKKKEQ